MLQGECFVAAIAEDRIVRCYRVSDVLNPLLRLGEDDEVQQGK